MPGWLSYRNDIRVYPLNQVVERLATAYVKVFRPSNEKA